MRRALNLPRSLALARTLAAVIGGGVLLVAGGTAEAGERLDAVKQRGFLTCGVGANVPGFSQRDATGVWRGFDVDICRAVAAAIFRRCGSTSRSSHRYGGEFSQRSRH